MDGRSWFGDASSSDDKSTTDLTDSSSCKPLFSVTVVLIAV